jgi:hypothetical protein
MKFNALLNDDVLKTVIEASFKETIHYYYFTAFKKVANIIEIDGLLSEGLQDYLSEKFELTLDSYLAINKFDLDTKTFNTSMFIAIIEKYEFILALEDDGSLLLFYPSGDSHQTHKDFCLELNEKFSDRLKKGPEILLLQKSNYLHFETVSIKVSNIDLSKNYNNDIIEIDKLIIEELNKNDNKGLFLLHGKPGTGKTSYLRHLITIIKNKPIIYISPEIALNIGAPEFIQLLLSKQNSIIIIEDAEVLLVNRDVGGGNLAIANLLNLSDGLLADCLNIQIICTFNTNLKNIDKALLRKGRLTAKYEFKELTIEKTNALLHSVHDKKFDEKVGLTLAEIYNYENKEFEPPAEKIGFGSL